MAVQHLFRKWDSVAGKLKDRRLFIFLDYDGTLTPITSVPNLALMPAKTQQVLERLSLNPWCRVAVISGRALEDIKHMMGLPSLIYSGNHGLEIEGPRIKFSTPMDPGYRRLLEQIKTDLNCKIFGIKGVFIEDKGYSLALHYRMVSKKNITRIITLFHETIIIPLVENRIKIKSGKMVLEVRPPMEWDKGKVVLWLLARQRFSSPKSAIVPIYIGDDLTDEDAFRALKHIGITVLVGKPQESSAHYYLNNTDEVRQLLERILETKERGNHVGAG